MEFEIPQSIEDKIVDDARPADQVPKRVVITRYYDVTRAFEYEPTIPDQVVSPVSLIEGLKAFEASARRLPRQEEETDEQASTRRSDLAEWEGKLEEIEDLRAEAGRESLAQLQREANR